MSFAPPEVEPHGVHVVDTGFVRPHFDAAFLIVENGRGAFIETGTTHSLPRLLEAVEHAGLTRDAVDYVIPTHVHLDHAGGAGALMRELPNAKLVVHPRGVRHMIDPTQLLAGARAVYGDEEVARSYGEVPGVAVERVIATADGMTIELAGRPLRFLDTPGHAKHHHCIWDEASRSVFTGDTFGLAYRELQTSRGASILITTPPVQFEPEAWRESIGRLVALDPRRVYVTHYGGVGDATRLARELLRQIDATAAIGEAARGASDRQRRLCDGLAALYVERLRAQGVSLPDAELEALISFDVELNAKGVAIWLDRGQR